MSDHVGLYLKRNRGWPWPDDSFGLSPMFGPDGWCLGCGMPLHEQSGSLVLRRKELAQIEGAWIPNWQFEAICLDRSLAEAVAARFDVDVRPVAWHGEPPGEAAQIVAHSVGDSWFDHDELRARTIARHGTAGATCLECDRWRWMPLPFESLPPLRIKPGLGSADIAASPEWFGDGWNSFRKILVVRELAELIVDASPKDFRIQEMAFA